MIVLCRKEGVVKNMAQLLVRVGVVCHVFNMLSCRKTCSSRCLRSLLTHLLIPNCTSLAAVHQFMAQLLLIQVLGALCWHRQR